MTKEMTASFAPGDHVRSEQFGVGQVETNKGLTVLVRFPHGFEECEMKTLAQVLTPLQAARRCQSSPPIEVIVRSQAETICSINDTWGVFSRSRIALLPHQLWVCRKVLERWPSRWLVADDVGLGKTIEACLILHRLILTGRAQRVLILVPESLVHQWFVELLRRFNLWFHIFDEERCDGCGECVTGCAEGALAVIDGKARVVRQPLDVVVAQDHHRAAGGGDRRWPGSPCRPVTVVQPLVDGWLQQRVGHLAPIGR